MTNPTNVSDEEIGIRSLMMRLYHSRIEGEAYYHKCFVNGEAPGLEAKGWIERRGDGWRMTEEGVKAWAEINAPVIASKHRQRDQNELLFALGRPIRRVALNKYSKGILKMLAEHGGAMRLADLHRRFGRGIQLEHGTNGLKSLQNGAYVISDGETVWFTGVGLMVVAEMNLRIGG